MISGTYKVSFDLELKGYENEEEATLAIAEWVRDMMEEDNFLDLAFELTSEDDSEYALREDELEELDFEEAG